MIYSSSLQYLWMQQKYFCSMDHAPFFLLLTTIQCKFKYLLCSAHPKIKSMYILPFKILLIKLYIKYVVVNCDAHTYRGTLVIKAKESIIVKFTSYGLMAGIKDTRCYCCKINHFTVFNFLIILYQLLASRRCCSKESAYTLFRHVGM